MGMSDCAVCWETPCSCGNEYKDWTVDRIKSQIEMLTNLLKEKESKSNEKKDKK